MFERVLNRIWAIGTVLIGLVALGSAGQLRATPVQQYGQLKIANAKLCSAAGTPVQLKGMSWFWSNWSGSFWTPAILNTMVDHEGITLARLAMGVDTSVGGYLADPSQKALVTTMVDAAIAKGIYVIIDWHEEQAQTHTEQSRAFFTEMATKYKNVPNVMFELFNEPNGPSWPTIRAYAETVGGAIRATGANNVIIVGTPTWSQEVDVASANPVSFSNAAYTFHFYSHTHTVDGGFGAKIQTAMSRGCAIVVTEWGTSNSSGNGDFDEAQTRKWMEFLNANSISWANWSVFNKDETCSFFKPGFTPSGAWSDANLSQSGLLVKQFFTAPTPPTALSVSPATLSLPYAGGSQTSALTASVGWTAVANQSWFSVTPTSGSTSATLTVTAQPNTGTQARTGIITITGNEGSTTSISVSQGVNDGNISTGKAVSASSTESALYPASNATDGSLTSRWSSAFSDPQWITVDLGASYVINKVVLAWEAAYAKGYQIQVSADGTTFTSIYATASGTGGTESITLTGTGRYVRMNGTARATAYGYSLFEFQVFGTPASTQTLSVTPASVALSSAAGTSSLAVTSNVAWTVSSSQAWLTATAGGSGNGTITLSASANTSSTSRSAVVTVGGPSGSGLSRAVTVTQSGQSTFSLKLEAENYYQMAGVQTEACSDAGGGLNVGYIDAGDWMNYPITVPSTGSYTIQYRVASPNSGKSLSSDLNAGSIQLGSVSIPNTGSWQTWTTVTQTVTLNAGTCNFGINAGTGGFNLNWILITGN